MYMLPCPLRLVASSIRRRACPCGDSGSDGADPTPTTTPSSLEVILSRASFPRPPAEAVSRISLAPPFRDALHSTSGSCTNVSSTDMSASRWLRSTDRVISLARMKTPSYPPAPSPSMMFCVSRNGTISGVSSSSPLSKRHEKSTCTQSPLSWSSRMFSPCLSPRPTTCPTMLHTAAVCANAVRAPCHAAGRSFHRFRNHRWNTGGNFFKISRIHVVGVALRRSCVSFTSASVRLWYRPSRTYSAWITCLNPVVCGTHSIKPQSSVSGTTANVRRYSRRLRDAASRDSKRLSIVVNSIMRRSFRKSSLGLHRKDCATPSDPITVSFFGFCSELKTGTSSSTAAIVATSSGNAFHSETVGTWLGLAAFRARDGGSVGASCVWFGTSTSHGVSRRNAGNSLLTEKLFAGRPLANGLGENAHTRMSWSHRLALCSKSGRALAAAPSLARSNTRCADAERSGWVLLAIAVMLHSTWLGKLRTNRCRSSWMSARVSPCGWHNLLVSCGSAGSHVYSGSFCEKSRNELVAVVATLRSLDVEELEFAAAAAAAPTSNHSVSIRGRLSYACLCPCLNDVA
mmetsp:Transcript_4253/g.18055  ORF Transcript_4253/g.18055 Transcript_4253/m.18055 type:complete len:572 (-) Transcript_4253:52-1767(-)